MPTMLFCYTYQNFQKKVQTNRFLFGREHGEGKGTQMADAHECVHRNDVTGFPRYELVLYTTIPTYDFLAIIYEINQGLAIPNILLHHGDIVATHGFELYIREILFA